MQTLDGWLSVMSFDLADRAFNNQWFMQIKKNGQIKHQTDMTQTRLSKTNIRVNWVKDSRPSVWPRFWYFWSKNVFLNRKWGILASKTMDLSRWYLEKADFLIISIWIFCVENALIWNRFFIEFGQNSKISLENGHFPGAHDLFDNCFGFFMTKNYFEL